MTTKELDGIAISYPEDMPEDEAAQYVKRGRLKYGLNLLGVEARYDTENADYVCISYNVKTRPFQRLRRITGKPIK